MRLDYEMAPSKRKERKQQEVERTKRAGAKYKKTRAEILDELDEFLTKEVVERSAQAGYPELGAGIAAGVSALADVAVPEDAVDAIATATGVGAAAKLGKVAKQASKRRKQLKRADLDLKKVRKETDAGLKRELAEEAPLTDDVLFKEGHLRKLSKKAKIKRRANKQSTQAFLDKYNVK